MKTKLHRITRGLGLGITGLFIIVNAYSQAPGNDEYTGAVSLTPAGGYTCAGAVSGTTVGATLSAKASCWTNRNDDDVWYRFKAVKTSHVVRLSNVTTVAGTGTYTSYRIIEVFKSQDGVPGEQIKCAGIADTEALLTGLVLQEDYFVRIYAWSTTNNITDRITFGICILTPPTPPVNDEYTGAVEMIPSAGYTCAAAVNGTTDGATESAQAECQTGKDEDDVWYKFTATRASHIVKLSNISTVYGAGAYTSYRTIEVFKSQEGMPTERIKCTGIADTETFVAGLTAGEMYFVRVYAWTTNNGVIDRITFGICVLTPPVPPANDEHTGAVEMIPNAGYTCGAAVNGTTDGATQSAQAECQTGRNDDDVWYKFTATRASHIVKLSNISTVYGAGAYTSYRTIEVFKSQGGVPTERIKCTTIAETETLLTELAIEQIYFVRVYAWSNTNGESDRIRFDICILSPVNPPANDQYTGAIELTANQGNVCTATTPGTTDGATRSPQDACTQYNNDDVWYHFTATQATHTLKLSDVTTAYGSVSYTYLEVFRKVEDAPGSRIFCSAGNFTETTLTGLTVGTVYFVRIYSFDVNNRVNFSICVLTPPIPSNDECAGAVDISGGSLQQGTTIGATQSLVAGSCALGTAYDVWYKVTPVGNGALTVQAITGNFNLVLEAYNGNCGSLASIACKNDGAGNETLTIPDAQAGIVYYLRVYNNTPPDGRISAETGAFTIRATGSALPVTLVSFTVTRSETNAVLRWATSSESKAGYFEIERSADTRQWNRIGRVAAKGESNGMESYSFSDQATGLQLSALGHLYYRLKMVDTDGSFAYGPIRSLKSEPSAGTKAVLYPNPARERLYMRDAPLTDILSLQVVNLMGKVMLEVSGVDAGGVYLKSLAPGVYLVKLTRKNGQPEYHKLIIGE